MADSIKIGNLDISAFKVGSDDCKVYLGDTLLYPQSQPQTLQWVTFSNGDTIPSDLQIYGIKGVVNDLNKVFMYTDDIYVEDAARNKYNVIIGGYYDPCYTENDIVSNTSVEYTFSNIGCSDYYTVSNKTIADMTNDIQLYIYDSPTPPTPTSYTYSVTIQGLENGDTTTIQWDAGEHTDYNVGNGTYTYTTTTDDIVVNLDTSGLSDYTVDYSQFVLYSGGSQTVTFTYQGGGGLESIPYGTDMSQYYNSQLIKRFVINDISYLQNVYTGIYCNNWVDQLTITRWNVVGQGQFSNITNLPIDVTFPTPVNLTSWNFDSTSINPFNDLQIEWA